MEQQLERPSSAVVSTLTSTKMGLSVLVSSYLFMQPFFFYLDFLCKDFPISQNFCSTFCRLLV